MFHLIKTTSTSKNDFYQILNRNKTPIKFFINNTYSQFGQEERFDIQIIKWELDNNLTTLLSIRDFEDNLISHFKKTKNKTYEVYSKIIKNAGFSEMIETNIYKDSFDTITHELGEVITFNDLKANIRCNVEIEVHNININKSTNKLYYNLGINRIHIIEKINDK